MLRAWCSDAQSGVDGVVMQQVVLRVYWDYQIVLSVQILAASWLQSGIKISQTRRFQDPSATGLACTGCLLSLALAALLLALAALSLAPHSLCYMLACITQPALACTTQPMLAAHFFAACTALPVLSILVVAEHVLQARGRRIWDLRATTHLAQHPM